MRSASSTAILIFANSAKQELSNKPLIGNEQLFEALTEHTLKQVQKTGLPFFHFTEKAQFGNTFHHRFVNALKGVFEKGYTRIIAIGNDTPHLNSKELLDAAAALVSDKVVIGPSADGGIYLLGLNHGDFNAPALLNLPWKTADLCRALVAYVEDKSRITKFVTRFDLDTRTDLKLFIARYKNFPRPILILILKSLEVFIAKIRLQIALINRPFTALYFNKGSPAIVVILRD